MISPYLLHCRLIFHTAGVVCVSFVILQSNIEDLKRCVALFAIIDFFLLNSLIANSLKCVVTDCGEKTVTVRARNHYCRSTSYKTTENVQYFTCK